MENDKLTKKVKFYEEKPEIKDIVEKHKREIEQREGQIELLKKKIYNINNPNLQDGERFVVINFKTYDNRILPIICTNRTLFSFAENQLYLQYPEYLNDRNIYIYDEFRQIDRQNNTQTLEEIGIHGYTIEIRRN